MKLFNSHTLAAILLACPSLVSAISSVKVSQGFLVQKEIEYYKSIPVSVDNEDSCEASDRIFGHVNLEKAFRRRIEEASGKTCTDETKKHADEVKVRTSLIHRTTDRHLDRVNNVGHEFVSFIFLNSNDDAYFHHGDTKVPVVAGNMVTFPGDAYHHTEVPRGEVHLLGPFDSNTYEPIGCGVTIECCGDTVNTAETCLAACDDVSKVECKTDDFCPVSTHLLFLCCGRLKNETHLYHAVSFAL